jgi:hypothetical protein
MSEEPFNPDWTLAPLALLRELIGEDRGGALATPDSLPEDERRLLAEVEARDYLTPLHAALLERETGVPARVWTAYEKQYRADLAAGRKDTTDA